MVTKVDLEKSISFNEYFDLVEKLAHENGTTGNELTQEKIDYTKLNYSRMKRILKTTETIELVKSTVNCLNDKITWLVLAESWCGDAAQNIPVMEIMTIVNPNIDLRVILRDDNHELMNQYLTNGGKSIPKLICLDEHLNELGTWGPRPAYLQDWMKREKENPTMEMSDLKEQFQIWYTKDKGKTLQYELIELMKTWLKRECA